MKLKLLLLLLLATGWVNAQLTCNYPEGLNRSLMITEARLSSTIDAYVEITNMSSQPINLREFKFGTISCFSTSSYIYDLCTDPWWTTFQCYLFLPDRVLDPGKSFVLTNAYDYLTRRYKEGNGREGGVERRKQEEIYQVADKLIHMQELVEGQYFEGDSVSTADNDPEQLTKRGDYQRVFSNAGLCVTYYLEHLYTPADSMVVDQVGGVFDYNGHNQQNSWGDLAGVDDATSNSILVRKASYKLGNLDYANARGVNLEDSEWIPLIMPEGYDRWRDLWWTVGNHGSFTLNENTLEPKSGQIQVNYAEKKITVPWGTLRLDEIMRKMNKKPGVAWTYVLNPSREDSLFRSARNGDQMIIHVVGNTLLSETFNIVVNEPTADDNIVIPIDHARSGGAITTRAQNGILDWPRVTRNSSGVDTITGAGFGLDFMLRTDSLLKYLEKPANARWDFVWIDGQPRPDLKDGDMLKVTSESGKSKEYYIQVQAINPSTNCDLASITWPDIPEFYYGLFGWKGDTIPNFTSGVNYYRLNVPFDVEGIPALVAKTSNYNAAIKVTRAKSMTGTLNDRTIYFEVTAEDGVTQKVYAVELIKEKSPDKIEPYFAEPFFSAWVNSYPTGVRFLEIFNPGNQPIDLRNYMVGIRSHASDFGPILENPIWRRRYNTYIPGLRHVDEQSWNFIPRIQWPDPATNPIVQGGESFIIAGTNRGDNMYPGIEKYWPAYNINFTYNMLPNHQNPWNEDLAGLPFPGDGNRRNSFFLYRLLNDSVKLGLKPNTDVNDFEVVDAWGQIGTGYWVIAGEALAINETGHVFIRKPHIIKGNPVRQASFGTSPEDCEWEVIKPNTLWANIPTPERYGYAFGSLGQHFINEITYYKSTVNSVVYKVSDGYGPNENIIGIKSGTTVAEFLGFINKEDPDQGLKVLSAADASELGPDAQLSLNDILVVTSKDGTNTTRYRLDVSEAGLNSNAYLTSTRWQITVESEPKSETDGGEKQGSGYIRGFDYGTTIKTIVDNVTVPAGAMLTVTDANGAYVPYQILNYDTSYVFVTVNPDIYLDVTAEDGITRMVYQLQPNTSASDAFILSDLYEVSQVDNLVQFVPRGTNFQSFLSNITPALGASVKLLDKMGFERVQGNIREDDKVVVTSSDGLNTRIYFISFLPTATVPATTYLAYVLSDAYFVDQVNYTIAAGIAPLTATTLLSEFQSYIVPCLGATIDVIDKNGNVKKEGDLDDGDVLKVTSADGKIAVFYLLTLDLTGSVTTQERKIEIYPNPVNENLIINGVNTGDRVRLYSPTGQLIRDILVENNFEVLPVRDIPMGFFVIEISHGNRLLGRYKAIRK